ncbi:MAG: NUDIX domain-containing protein [Ruminococcus sp.]|nr:NUDIX domain-containing protein [Ruminococcus sp.]
MDYVSYIRGMVGHEPVMLIAGGMILHDGEGRILLQQRRDCGKWGISGGICELGETAAQAAHRELLEETGLTASEEYLLGIYSSNEIRELENGDKVQTFTVVLVGHVTGGTPTEGNEETAALGWFAENEIPEIYSARHKKIIEDYFKGARGVCC